MSGRYKPSSEIAPSVELISDRYQPRNPVEARNQLYKLASEGTLDEWRKQAPEVVQWLEKEAEQADKFCLEQITKGNLQARKLPQTLEQGNCAACRYFAAEFDGGPISRGTLRDLIQACNSDVGSTYCEQVYAHALKLLKALIEAPTQSSS